MLKPIALLLAALAAAAPVAVAEEAAPAPKWNVEVSTGVVSVATRGQKREYAQGALTVTGQLTPSLTTFGRGLITGQQDGGALDITKPKSFRTVEGSAGLRLALGRDVDAVALGGATYSIEGDAGRPVDARLFTAALGLRVPIHETGYAYVLAGHHGPVGGPALLFAASYPVKAGASTVIDVAFPFQRTAFRDKAWTLTAGARVHVKGWSW